MTIEEQVKARIGLKDALKSLRSFYRLVLGEFNRVDDGKPITDEQACKVLKKMISSNLEMIKLVDDVEAVALGYENGVMKGLLPTLKVATEQEMYEAIEASIPSEMTPTMKMMMPICQCLEARGFDIDKKKLSGLLKGMTR